MEMDIKKQTYLQLCRYRFLTLLYCSFLCPGGYLTHACRQHTYNHTHIFCPSVHSLCQTHACIPLHSHNRTPMFCMLVKIVQTLNTLTIKSWICILTKIMARKYCSRAANSCLLFKSKYKIIFYSQNHPT